ncbi:Protein kinase-like domain [Pseudocohnilembus persalinus]|uniref:Protein kinase-like domain n=1 Tax=Pseudocohnilembus persalinus TaxID=266149 RepID=A0A0V0QRU5_PSEPJ|nr:Protein kinase-like domain [Pseudocohnilembus persalinus]|eukprot:KRX04744.1 Protein kinase-like domain [Pseudocohnilembus persalinus]
MQQINQVDLGNFQFNKKFCLGQGNFGKVYQGQDKKNGKIVAIKEIERRGLQNNDYLKQQFRNETQIIKNLPHNQNIVKFIELVEVENYIYLVQEFCKDGDLKDKIVSFSYIEENEALIIIQQIIEAFQHLHKYGIIHRDLKPANILIHDDKYKLADFGFAKTLQQNIGQHMLTSVVGSPYYMSPQLLKNDKYSYKTDIWSLGMIFYEMLFGDLPWMANDPKCLLQKILNDPVNCKRKNISLSKESIELLKMSLLG